MNAPALSFTFDWRPGEHARVTSLLIRERFSSGIWRILKWAVVLVLAVSATLTIVVAATGDLTSTAQLGPLTLLVSGLTWKFPILTGRLQARRIKRSDPNVAHPITHSFDDSGLHIGMRTINTELKWEGMNRVRETPEMFLVYYSRRTAYFLPKRAVSGSDGSVGLADWIRSRLPATWPTSLLEGAPSPRAPAETALLRPPG